MNRRLTIALIALLLVAALPARAERAVTHVVRVPARAATALADLDLRPSLALDYGTFAWLELAVTDFARLLSSSLAYEIVDAPYTLALGEQRFDPRAAPPALPAGWDAVRADVPDLHLVQFAGPIRSEWLAALEQNGLRAVQYIHPFTYVVWGTPDALARAAAAPAVRWTGAFAPAYRVLPRWRALPAQPIAVHAMLYRGADTDTAVNTIVALGAQVTGRATGDGTFEIAGFTLPGNLLQAVARVPGVYSVQPVPSGNALRGEMSNQINAGNYAANNQAVPGYGAWLNGIGLDGGGVIIANVDSGVDQTHPDLAQRIVACTGTTCGGSQLSYHGTHTAGIMAADGVSGVLDPRGFLRGLGMAPGAHLVEQVYSPWYTQPGGMLLLMTESYRNGAALSGNSWGPSDYPLGYDEDTRQVDAGVRDADPAAPGNQPFSFVLSIMNGGGGISTQGTPDEAKNLFGVGSTKMQDSDGSQILAIDDLSGNSAHGPALDGRKLPQIVAPGCNVDSTVPGGYDLMCGTSMASPHVSGAVALFIEYYRGLPAGTRGLLADPSPAMVKAAFLPTAHDLAGHLDADGNVMGHPFDNRQGWGRLNLAAVVHPEVVVHYFDSPVLLDETGQQWLRLLVPADLTKPMRFMLAWTDAPGHGLGGSAPAWNNDLDLVVEAGGNVYYGNRFGADGWSVPGGSADGMNNTEGVFLGPTAPGSVLARVVGANINSDGVPGVGDITDQDFALACYNCVPVAGPVYYLPIVRR